MLDALQNFELEVLNDCKAKPYDFTAEDGKHYEGINCTVLGVTKPSAEGKRSIVKIKIKNVKEDYQVKKGLYTLKAPTNYFRNRGVFYEIGFALDNEYVEFKNK